MAVRSTGRSWCTARSGRSAGTTSTSLGCSNARPARTRRTAGASRSCWGARAVVVVAASIPATACLIVDGCDLAAAMLARLSRKRPRVYSAPQAHEDGEAGGDEAHERAAGRVAGALLRPPAPQLLPLLCVQPAPPPTPMCQLGMRQRQPAGDVLVRHLGVAALPPWMNALAGHGDKFQRAFPGMAERILGI